ncbi:MULTISPECIES: DNA-binding protein [Stenotrophomonas]|uniref:helix-turn-helix domain-containing transcriptional regulator n=1 Tax=Stenotrophomonas TaxID=40323 RepID=UPI001F54E07F|nr:hypothetical protein [Stenotrophomonas maltophilia]
MAFPQATQTFTQMSKLKTTPFDPEDYLDDDVAIATYLGEALAAGDTSHFQEALGTVACALSALRTHLIVQANSRPPDSV